MAASTLWRGHLRLSLVTVGVRTHAAVDSAAEIRLHQIHSACGSRLKQVLRCPECACDVDRADVGRAAAGPGGDPVVLTEDALAACRPESSKVIDLTRFVPVAAIPAVHREKPYRLAPDGAVHRGAFVVLRDALADRAGLGTVAIRGREHAVAVMVEGPGLTMWQLRRADAVRSVEDVQDWRELPAPDREQTRLMRRLIDSMTEDVMDPATLGEDSYLVNLRAAVERAAAGGDGRKSATVVALTDQLRASLPAAKRRKRTATRRTATAAAAKRTA